MLDVVGVVPDTAGVDPLLRSCADLGLPSPKEFRREIRPMNTTNPTTTSKIHVLDRGVGVAPGTLAFGVPSFTAWMMQKMCSSRPGTMKRA